MNAMLRAPSARLSRSRESNERERRNEFEDLRELILEAFQDYEERAAIAS